MPTPALIVAGTHSGSGKTTVTLAVMAALVRRGWEVQGFKVGPDFIDPGHQSAVTGRTGRNLDTWMLDDRALGSVYSRGVRGADLAVIEGVMGLFDGRGALDESGSTADLARRLKLPAVLVVDARGMARSIAPLVRGFASFDGEVEVAGVIANRVGSRRHYESYLAPAIAQSCPGVRRLGYLARSEGLSIPSRHLGLRTADEFAHGSAFLGALADAAESSIDLDRLIGLARAPNLAENEQNQGLTEPATRIAWARDPAFCFYYEDNLDLLREAGGEVVPFSPLEDRAIPEGAGLLYLGGGYPEVFAEHLASNRPMRESIRRFHAEGGAILAECGGLMACCRELVDADGRTFPLWDLIPARVSMGKAFARLGYVTAESTRGTHLGPPGTAIRGHEFHYSTLEPLGHLEHATILRREGEEPRPDGIQVGGLLAGYAHLHFGSNPDVARHLVSSATGTADHREIGSLAPPGRGSQKSLPQGN